MNPFLDRGMGRPFSWHLPQEQSPEVRAAVLAERARCADIVRNSGPFPVLVEVLVERIENP